MNAAGDALEFAVRFAHAKHAVARALTYWETWVVIASVGYLAVRFWPWAQAGFQIVGR